MSKPTSNRIRAIIPCAGLGTRVGMMPNQSKELLYNKEGLRLIDNVLEVCRWYGFDPLIVSRKEKKDLNKYIKELGHDLQIINPKGEWQDTVLSSSKYWHEKNLLILPDTDFERKPLEYLYQFFSKKQLVLFTHMVEDGNKWGCVDYSRDKVVITEKPKDATVSEAWGMIGFTAGIGEFLFKQLKKGQFIMSECDATIIPLTKFEDLTRNKHILKWQPGFR